MGVKIFGIDIQKEIAAVVKPTDAIRFTLTKTPLPEDDENNLSGPGTVGTPVDYDCHGFVLDFELKEMDLDSTKNEPEDAAGVIRGDKKILIIGKQLSDAGVEPEPDDMITIVSTGRTYRVVKAKTDTAFAKWICHCRGR